MRKSRSQKPEAGIQKKRKSVNAARSLFILVSVFWLLNSAFRPGFCFSSLNESPLTDSIYGN